MEYDKNLKRSVGKRVHDFRVQHDYTQAQFAEFMDISVNFLSEIENGKKGMSQETLYRLCQQFHISSDYILFGITLEDAAKKPDTIIDIANHLSAEELTQVIEYLNSLKMMKLSEFVNKKLHAIFHRASKQFKVDARDLACGYGCTFPPLYPLPDAAVGMTTTFSSPVPSFQRHRWHDDAFSSPVPSFQRHRGYGSAFSLLHPLPGAAVGMTTLFPLLYPLPDAAVGMTTTFSSPVPSFQRHRGYDDAFPSPAPSFQRHRGYDDAFPSPVPSSRRRCGYDDAFPSPVPSFQRHRGYGSAFSLLHPLPGVLHTLTNSLTRPSLGGSFYICTSFLSTGLPHPAQLPLQPLHPPQHCPLLSLRSSLRTIKKTVIAIIVIIMISAISASCPCLCSSLILRLYLIYATLQKVSVLLILRAVLIYSIAYLPYIVNRKLDTCRIFLRVLP